MTDNKPISAPATARDYTLLAARGFLMGSADVVPGVSGGTVAFITGVYEPLIEAISAVNLTFVRHLLRLEVRQAFAGIPWQFLLALGMGIAAAVLTVSHGLSWALANYPTHVWGFFFGLIAASILAVFRRVRRWTALNVAVLVAFTAGMLWLVGLTPAEMPHTPLALFLSGALASCAMILPGISGAFILVLVGQYHYALQAVVTRDWFTLLVLGSGALIGLAAFARLLKWLFHRHHDLTVAALIGLMIGSLRKIWPWKVTTAVEVEPDGTVIPLVQMNVWPDSLSLEVGIVALLAVLGFGAVLVIELLAWRMVGRRASPQPQQDLA